MSIQDRCQGAILGLAAGDRNGGPIRMALCLARSLLRCRDFDPWDVIHEYFQWWREDGRDTGPTAATVFSLIHRGAEPLTAAQLAHESLNGKTAGCNPSHRAAPLALAGFLPSEKLPSLATEEAGLTHYHSLAGAASAAVVSIIRRLLEGQSWTEAMDIRSDSDAIQQAIMNGRQQPGDAGGYAPEVLQSAVYFVHQGKSFSDALTQSLSFAGPANYCPVLVGAIAGARWGKKAIAEEMLSHPALNGIRGQVEAMAGSLSETW